MTLKCSALLGFCSKSGANIPDTFSIREYLANGLDVWRQPPPPTLNERTRATD